MVKLHTNFGEITLELDAEKAPITVANFLQYVNSGFYDNTIFHRVINGFMIQGGGFEPSMAQKPTKTNIKNEADNGLQNKAYTIAMARTPNPDSASSQFFINISDNDFLDFTAPTSQGWGYCVFGKVTAGTDVVDKIKQVKTGSKGGHQDVPLEPVLIERAEVIKDASRPETKTSAAKTSTDSESGAKAKSASKPSSKTKSAAKPKAKS
jgi:peptidyl-prolyl cis-trans isomerase B (cyclophilin B)